MARVICVNNNKGGSLKTTTVSNLAGVLALQNKRVLIIDADNQSNIALSFGKNPDKFKAGLFQVLTGSESAESVIVRVHEYIDILPSNDDLIGFDFEIIGKSFKYKQPFNLMNETCSRLKDRYDYILIDTPPSLSLMVGNAFKFADEVLIPYSPESYSMRSLTKVVRTIKEFQKASNPNLKLLGIVATMVNFRTNIHTEIMQQTRKYATENNLTLFDTYIPHSIRFASSVAYEGVPATLSTNHQDKIKSEVFFELWKEIEGIGKEK